jgi:UDP-N-acetylglucosamine--N-acetylmuramyl-(pentapeptide) pyrophosphoryl-undecaprenol N-acetylglucosamine transferase
MTAAPTIWVMAGGTGGHIMPGLAVAEILRTQGCAVRWLGNPDKMEGRLVRPAGFEMIALRFSGVRGKGLRDLIRAPFALLACMWGLWREISRQRPDVVLGMGGYVALPGGLTARLRGVPIVLHEQNAIAGKTNQWLAKIAQEVLVGFPNALPKSQWVGNPVRAAMGELLPPKQRYSERKGPIRILVVGGSLGAAALNEMVPLALSQIDKDVRPIVMHQSGEQHLMALQAAYDKVGVHAQCVAFIDDMATAMSQADLLICRAGAMTVAEVAAVGVAALFVPFPFAVDDHQTANAQYLVEHQAGFVKQQRELVPSDLAQWLQEQTRESLALVAQRAHAQAKPDAARDIAKRCLAFTSRGLA